MSKISDKEIINITKTLLAERVSNFCIRTILHILERLSTSSVVTIRLTAKQLENTSSNDIKELALIQTSNISFDRVHTDAENITLRFYYLTYSAIVILPQKHGKKKTIKNEDRILLVVNDIWEYWLANIGSIKEIFKKKPTLTTSRDGRLSYLKRIVKNSNLSAEDGKLAIDGALCSPFHMGFDINTGQKTKPYCDIKYIFPNMQRVEEMASRAGGVHYKTQIEQAQQRIELTTIHSTSDDNKDEEDVAWLN